MEKPCSILHLDLDAFFCAVEALRNPSLEGKAFAVGGMPEGRGVIASCSYAARRYGIRSAMPMVQAFRLCPHLIAVRHHGDYGRYSRKVMDLLDSITPNVEQISIDECFIDATDLGDTHRAAKEIQTRIKDELSLPSSLGGASSKLVAKIATSVSKDQPTTDDWPYAILIVPPGEEPSFLAPLPVSVMWGVGPKTAEQMESIGLRTLGDVQARDADELEASFGSYGPRLREFAFGIDEREVEPTGVGAKSVSHETTFATDLTDQDRLHSILLSLSQRVGKSIRGEGITCRTVAIKLRWSDFTTITRRVTLAEGTDLDRDIYASAKRLFEKAWGSERPIRLLGVAVSQLEAGGQQMSLWGGNDSPSQRMQIAFDDLRDRFGGRKARWGREVKHARDDDDEAWWEGDA